MRRWKRSCDEVRVEPIWSCNFGTSMVPIGWPSIFFAIIERVANGYGLLHGACHSARIRATRWLAMTKLHLRCGKATRRANHPKVCPALRAKTFRLTCRANQRHNSARLTQSRGGSDRHERAVGCGGRELRGRRARMKRTAKSCGPDAAVLASNTQKQASAYDGGKRAVHRGEREVSRKAIAQGRPECFR